jgi:hypothetical protein
LFAAPAAEAQVPHVGSCDELDNKKRPAGSAKSSKKDDKHRDAEAEEEVEEEKENEEGAVEVASLLDGA